MDPHSLYSISPADGRYRSKTNELQSYFSEYALMKYRVKVEVAYLIALKDISLPRLNHISEGAVKQLQTLADEFTEKDALKIKEIESRINHDVKAVEYFIKEKCKEAGAGDISEFVHFGLTSQDINNTAFPLMLKDAVEQVYSPLLSEITNKLRMFAVEWKDISMLARTHGQPASPTTLGKEIFVFADRINEQLHQLKQIPYSAKFGGATGNFNAHYVAYPGKDWVKFANEFISSLGLKRSDYTTQIEHYDNMAALFDCLKRINTILFDFCRDMWTYISMDYFKQKINKEEVGSSAMPHKVNPIDFENAEGNLGLANALFNHLSGKLPVSRLQRDLTDSTVIRNIGMPVAHTLIALKSVLKGMGKLELNKPRIEQELNDHWIVLAEAIQNILRREGYPKPYETLKELTRTNQKIDQKAIHNFINELNINNEVKEELKMITPFNYVGRKYQP